MKKQNTFAILQSPTFTQSIKRSILCLAFGMIPEVACFTQLSHSDAIFQETYALLVPGLQVADFS